MPVDFMCRDCRLWEREEPEDSNGTCHYDPFMVLVNERAWCYKGMLATAMINDTNDSTPGDVA